jgi:Transposase IS4
MSRDRFTEIQSSLKFYPEYNHAVAVVDPLWHSQIMLRHFMKNAASVAVPKGCSALDENTIHCKAHTGARSYMKSKPVKFGIRFYAVVGLKHAYVHSLWDNGSGNKTNVPPVQSYCKVFRDLRGSYDRFIDSNLINPKSASALWCLQMAHQTKLFKNSNKKRILVMDNFYTMHVLACQLRLLSEEGIGIIGTVHLNNVNAVNRPLLKEAISMICRKT